MRILINPSNPLFPIISEENEFPPKSFLGRVREKIRQYELNFHSLALEETLETPPWKHPSLNLCTHMYQFKKSAYTTNELKNLFMEHLHIHQNQLNIYTDGSKTNNGVGSAYFTTQETTTLRIPDTASNFTAELHAIKIAIEFGENQPHETINIITDSKSTIQALNKLNNRNPITSAIIYQILQSRKTHNFCWVPSHIGIPGNEAADNAAKIATEYEHQTNLKIPRPDYKSLLKKLTIEKWQHEWESIPTRRNKLRKLKDNIRPFSTRNFSDRHWERTLCRLRIGHTALTHSFLMNGGGEPPMCEECEVPLTIAHIFTDCTAYANQRIPFNNIPFSILIDKYADKHNLVYNFLQATNLINDI